MKKIFCLIMAAAFISVAAVSCTNNKTNEENDSTVIENCDSVVDTCLVEEDTVEVI